MLEIVLRLTAVLFLGIMLVAFGWYFSFGTDTLQHDWIYFGGGIISLLSGLFTLSLVGMMARQVKEYGINGLMSDQGYPEPPPPVRGGAAPAAAVEPDQSEEGGDSE